MNLPTIEPPRENESVLGFGFRVLIFVLETGVTATIETEHLELADHVYPACIRGFLDRSGQSKYLTTTADDMSRARLLILAALRTRASEATAAPVPPAKHDKPTGAQQVAMIKPVPPLAPIGAADDIPF